MLKCHCKSDLKRQNLEASTDIVESVFESGAVNRNRSACIEKRFPPHFSKMMSWNAIEFLVKPKWLQKIDLRFDFVLSIDVRVRHVRLP